MSKLTTADINRLLEHQRRELLTETHRHGWNVCLTGFMPGALTISDPVQMCWENGIIRTYERADHINWANLPDDGSVRWRKP